MKRAIIFPERNFKPTGPILRGLIKARKSVGAEILGFKDHPNFNRYDSAIIFVNRPDKIPFIETSCKIGWWMCDLRNNNALEDLQSPLDAIFLCNKRFLNRYAAKFKTKTYYMPQTGLSSAIFAGRPIDWDVIFLGNISDMGSYHKNRLPIIERISTKFDVKVVYKDRYTLDSKWLYRMTPFSLAISPQVEGYTSNRLYNIISSKGFCLTLWFPGIDQLFQNHKHLVWFKKADEAIELIKYYYARPKLYAKIKEQGHKIYLKKHTPQKRLENMFDILEGRTNEFYGYR